MHKLDKFFGVWRGYIYGNISDAFPTVVIWQILAWLEISKHVWKGGWAHPSDIPDTLHRNQTSTLAAGHGWSTPGAECGIRAPRPCQEISTIPDTFTHMAHGQFANYLWGNRATATEVTTQQGCPGLISEKKALTSAGLGWCSLNLRKMPTENLSILSPLVKSSSFPWHWAFQCSMDANHSPKNVRQC